LWVGYLVKEGRNLLNLSKKDGKTLEDRLGRLGKTEAIRLILYASAHV
jgi:hypothetical protein